MKFTGEYIKRAWEIRRNAAEKYGCGVMEISWRECLKLAKKGEDKMGTETKLIEAGGKLWEKGEHRRIYFNNLSEIFGIECNRYKTGNIQSAWIDNEPISNAKATEVYSSLDCGKLWYNCLEKKWECSMYSNRAFSVDEMFKKLVDRIEAKIA